MEEHNINSIATLYLRELHEKGMKSTLVLHDTARLKSSSIYGDADVHDYLRKIDRQFKERLQREKEIIEEAARSIAVKQEEPEYTRFDIDEIPDKFILKCQHRYFYGMKKSQIVWTYDILLALQLTDIEAEAITGWLEDFGYLTAYLPAPTSTNRNAL